jgi:hypothetical protein
MEESMKALLLWRMFCPLIMITYVATFVDDYLQTYEKFSRFIATDVILGE